MSPDTYRILFVVEGIDKAIADQHTTRYGGSGSGGGGGGGGRGGRGGGSSISRSSSPLRVSNRSFDTICSAAYVLHDLEVRCRDKQVRDI